MITRYQRFVDEKIKEISKEKNILDVGGGKRFQKWLEKYKDLFRESNYQTLDYNQDSGADIIGDIHHLPLANDSLDAVICSSVLEHVAEPVRAVEEIRRVLKPGGKIFVYIPSIYPYHAKKGSYADYWRFFDDTVDLLFRDFTNYEVIKYGGYFKALSFFFPAQHRFKKLLEYLANFLDKLFNTKNRTTTAGYYIFAIK